LPAEAEQGRAGCNAAEEKIDGDVVTPGRRLDYRAAIIGSEFGLRDHGNLPGAVTVAPAAACAGFAFLSPAAGGFCRTEAVEL
jgi:hypothetical protein